MISDRISSGEDNSPPDPPDYLVKRRSVLRQKAASMNSKSWSAKNFLAAISLVGLFMAQVASA